jgi:23S rRNA pseudouridine1911/1915/1917 synthase
MKLAILYEDDDFVVVDKPAGITVIPDRTDSHTDLTQLLTQQLKQKLWVAHRIDKQTSGLVCFAKNEEAHRHLSLQFQEHTVEKYYQGIVSGKLFPESGEIREAIAHHPTVAGKMVISKHGKPSHTTYNVLKQWPLYALVQFRIYTGRTHQIRVHMQSLGHPILCDELYGSDKPLFLSSIKRGYKLSLNAEEKPLLSRLALHAFSLSFQKISGEHIHITSPLPKDIQACVKQLDKWCS